MTSLEELLHARPGLTIVHVERWVARGLLRPVEAGDAWTFDPADVARARLLGELVDDLGMDDDTVVAVFGLIDQVHTLREQLDLLARAIAIQPAATRESIATALQRLRER